MRRLLCGISIIMIMFIYSLILTMTIQNSSEKMLFQQSPPSKPRHYTTIYFVTPTYNRTTQEADLTRLAQTLYSVEDLLWIVIEDSHNKTDLVTDLLKRYKIPNVHLVIKTPGASVHRGLPQRNIGLDWIRQKHVKGRAKGLIYFGDDDNTYDWRLFIEIRKVKRIGTLPVGFSGLKIPGGRPIVKNGKIVDFIGWKPEGRIFPIDMAGFVLNADVLFEFPSLKFIPTKKGLMESKFLEQFTTIDELEILAENCTKYYVWHTVTGIVNPKTQH